MRERFRVEAARISAGAREAVLRHARLKLGTIRDDDRLAGDLGLDSLAMLNVVLDLEDRFDVDIDPSRLSELRDLTFRDLVELLQQQLSQRAANHAV